ncbi:MAG: hypothetical protein UIJ87_09165 [Anaerovoracaceae bacterium]|nr:hypothetical protein [Anaerovoracaceae bacterium]
MTGKLIKYEFRSALRLIAIVWAALLAAAIFLGIILRTMGFVSAEAPKGVFVFVDMFFSVVPPLLYGALFIAMLVITVIVVVLRFYRGLLGDEGYLMHTLPVKPWQLITAKGVVASAVILISGFAAMLSIFMLIAIQDIGGFFRDIGEMFIWLGDNPKAILITLEIIVILVFSVMRSVYQIYTAMAIGQLAGKHRLLTSLGAYIGINMILTVLLMVLMIMADATGMDIWIVNVFEAVDVYDRAFYIGQTALGILFALTFVQVAAFHVVTERILSKKLNLI